MMKIMLKSIAAFALAASVAACDIDVPDLNNPGVDSLADSPTPSAVKAAATGLLIGNRVGIGAEAGFVSNLGILGRESYNFDTADPRYVNELLVAPDLDPGAGAFGGNFWTAPYSNIKGAFTLIKALEKVVGFSDAEKEAIRGFAMTIQALDFLVVIETHDKNGAPIDVDRGINDPLAPIATKDEVYKHIRDLLDEAKTHLAAGGDAFPFPLSSGFAGFDTPATFLKFNRAIKARVDVYSDQWADALVALGESFISADPADPKLDVGVYYVYSTGSGDVQNFLVNPVLYVHPSVAADADKKANGDLDDRVTRKTVQLMAPVSGAGGLLMSDRQFTMYPSPTAPIPLIRNEELILLRAEANIGLGTPAGLMAAIDDINFIRVNSGGLAPRTDLTSANILDELLKQKRYSLLFEGGHRWIDLRHYNKLDELPLDQPNFVRHDALPIPSSETDARQ
jgi:hypothetical protein